MIERCKYGTEVTCDGCSEFHESNTDDWGGAVGEIKELGWKVTRDKEGGWEHRCPGCTEEAWTVDDNRDGLGMPEEGW